MADFVRLTMMCKTHIHEYHLIERLSFFNNNKMMIIYIIFGQVNVLSGLGAQNMDYHMQERVGEGHILSI